MDRQFRKEITQWKKFVLKYKIGSSTSADNLKEILSRVKDSGDSKIEKRCMDIYSKSWIYTISYMTEQDCGWLIIGLGLIKYLRQILQ